MKIIFSTDEKNIEYLDKGLDRFNHSHAPEREKKEFGFFALEKNQIIGGVNGYLQVGYWAKVDMLFVDDKFRGHNIGTQLMEKVENFAVENSCIGMLLSTFDWQAKEFYEKMGFSVYGILDNMPKIGSKKYDMKKQL